MSRQDRDDQALNVLSFDLRGALCGPSLLCFEADAASGSYLVDNDEIDNKALQNTVSGLFKSYKNKRDAVFATYGCIGSDEFFR
jgi:hypothetical protein